MISGGGLIGMFPGVMVGGFTGGKFSRVIGVPWVVMMSVKGPGFKMLGGVVFGGPMFGGPGYVGISGPATLTPVGFAP